jgi:O-acetyl-ADP-ribose deacetylase (regulator of RNase III)
MEVGAGMMFPASVVDGLVHLHGGWALRSEIETLKAARRWRRWWRSSNEAEQESLCPVGTAVATSAGRGSTLARHYDVVVHACPPFYLHDDDPLEKLAGCYRSALALAFPSGGAARAASPLLGAGARGFPADAAMEVASWAAVEWLLGASKGDSASGALEEAKDNAGCHTLAFVLLEDSLADELASRLDAEIERSASSSR